MLAAIAVMLLGNIRVPELKVAGKTLNVTANSNLLDSLLSAGFTVPYSCRAGSCHACMVRCSAGEPLDKQPELLTAEQRDTGWRLACQCTVQDDLTVELFDPAQDGRPAQIVGLDWLAPDVLRLRLQTERPLRYSAGQHLLLWSEDGIARPYSLASVPELDAFLEFHLDCGRPGAFSDRARHLQLGNSLRLGEVHGGALHYDAAWQARPLLLLAAGTGLAPLWGVLRAALQSGHQAPIRLLHMAHTAAEHYLVEGLLALAAAHEHLQVELIHAAEASVALAELRLVSRQTIALVCGSPSAVDNFSRCLYLAGLPRSQLYADVFLPHAP